MSAPEQPSHDDIREAVNFILSTHDLQTITLRMVMTMLASRFSLPKETLAPNKPLVRTIINSYLQNNYQPGDDTPDKPQPTSPDPVPASSTSKRPAPAAEPAAKKQSLKPVKLTGLERPVVLSQPLADFFGDVVIPRSHIPKRISVYAKEHDLQDPSDRRIIRCDAALKQALNCDSFTFFELAKLIAGLVYKPDECDPELQELAKVCEEKLIAEKMERIANGELTRRPEKKRKTNAKSSDDKPRKPSGLQKPMQLSDALVAVCGEAQLPRSEVLKKIWVYIRENGLKDPDNRTRILCDEKLMAVFDGSKTVTNMGITKYLSAHMTKIEQG